MEETGKICRRRSLVLVKSYWKLLVDLQKLNYARLCTHCVYTGHSPLELSMSRRKLIEKACIV